MGIETLAMASMAMSALGGVVGAGGALLAGQQTKQMYEYKAKVADNMAGYERQVGEQKAQQQQMKTAALISKQKVGQAASGIDVNFGSAVDVRASTAELGMLDALTIKSGGEVRANALQQEAILSRAAGENAETASYFNAGATALGATSSVSDKWAKYKTAGIY